MCGDLTPLLMNWVEVLGFSDIMSTPSLNFQLESWSEEKKGLAFDWIGELEVTTTTTSCIFLYSHVSWPVALLSEVS